MLHSHTGELIPPWQQKPDVSVILVRWISRFLLICFMCLQAAPLRILMFFSVLAIQAPRYLKQLTSSRAVPSFVLRGRPYSLADIIRHIFGLATVHLEPTEVSTRQSSSCACCTSSNRRAMSSAKSRSVSTSGPICLLVF